MPRLSEQSITRAVSRALADLLDDAAGDGARTIAEVEFLAGPDPPHVRRVEAFVAVDHGKLTYWGQRIDIEERLGHGLSATAERFA